jgi:hypothetical protein
MESGENMSNKNIRIMQAVLLLMVNNAFILLAVADIDFLNIALYGGWGLIVIAGIYLARAIEESEAQQLSDRLYNAENNITRLNNVNYKRRYK